MLITHIWDRRWLLKDQGETVTFFIIIMVCLKLRKNNSIGIGFEKNPPRVCWRALGIARLRFSRE
jgi:hypothetical protein